ncbi:MAG: 2'-5' RNA ligase family protein [Acidimicrobiia bacterium]
MSRLFIALWPPDDVLDQLEALPRVERAGVRWTTREQWHVTLRFLGGAELDAAARALSTLRHPPVEAALSGRIGRLGRSVLMVPVTGLDSLAAAVLDATAEVVAVVDGRGSRFLGHLTLARLKGAPACGLIGAELDARWQANEVSLVDSVHGSGPASYRTLATVPLG